MIDSKMLKKYRKIAQKVGLWDERYISIKRDLQNTLNIIREKDRCLDVIGASIEQMKLTARLIVYGEADEDISDEQLEIILSPLKELEDLNYSAYLIKPGVSDASEKLFPFIFGFFDSCDDADSYEKEMRAAVAGPANLSSFSLCFAMGIATCMRKYDGMSRYYDKLVKRMEDLISSSPYFQEKYLIAAKSLKKKIPADGNDYYKFVMIFGGLLVACNLGYVPMREVGDLVDYINTLSTPAMKSFIGDSRKFKLLLGSIDEYYELSD